MPKLRPAELSLVLPALAASAGKYSGNALLAEASQALHSCWPHQTVDTTVLALMGQIPPDAAGNVASIIPAELQHPSPAGWSKVFCEPVDCLSTLWPNSKPLAELFSQLGDNAVFSRGDHVLVVDYSESSRILEAAFAGLKSGALGWLTLYPCNGDVLQWNRAAVRRRITDILRNDP